MANSCISNDSEIFHGRKRAADWDKFEDEGYTFVKEPKSVPVQYKHSTFQGHNNNNTVADHKRADDDDDDDDDDNKSNDQKKDTSSPQTHHVPATRQETVIPKILIVTGAVRISIHSRVKKVLMRQDTHYDSDASAWDLKFPKLVFCKDSKHDSSLFDSDSNQPLASVFADSVPMSTKDHFDSLASSNSFPDSIPSQAPLRNRSTTIREN